MHHFMRRYRKAGLTILAVFTVQLIAVSFCAIPPVHAAPLTTGGAMPMDITAMQCNMDMPTPVGQDMPEDAHCKTPDFNTFSNQVNDVSVSRALIAVLPTLQHQPASVSEQEQALIIVSEAPPRSTSLIYQTSLRIRL
ncbi:MAG: hypothetical protein BMS9Abin18_0409 [Zetaproteobacteria bacterium]|nr:MAG: hypothetical protein BMS9Abin18_0409 [Zetaproteobacteria bacterium]